MLQVKYTEVVLINLQFQNINLMQTVARPQTTSTAPPQSNMRQPTDKSGNSQSHQSSFHLTSSHQTFFLPKFPTVKQLLLVKEKATTFEDEESSSESHEKDFWRMKGVNEESKNVDYKHNIITKIVRCLQRLVSTSKNTIKLTAS